MLPLRQALSRALCKIICALTTSLSMDTCGCLSLLAYTAKWLYLLITHGFLRDGMWSICSLRTRFRACESFRGAWNSRMVSPILFHPNRVIVFYSEKIPYSLWRISLPPYKLVCRYILCWDFGCFFLSTRHILHPIQWFGRAWSCRWGSYFQEEGACIPAWDANGHLMGHCQWANDGPLPMGIWRAIANGHMTGQC